MWLKDTLAAAGIIWNWWTHSRILATPAALLLRYQPTQTEPLRRGCGWLYPAAFLSLPKYLSIYLPSMYVSVFTLSGSLKHRDKVTHAQVSLSQWELSTVTLWPAAETVCLRAAAPAPDSTDSFRRKSNAGDPFTDLLPVVRPAEPGSGRAHDCIHFKIRSYKMELLFVCFHITRICILTLAFKF